MKTLVDQRPWFAAWFDSNYYRQLYRERDEREAKNFIDILLSELAPARASVMLDLGCGNGRHSKYLASKGYNVLGLDLAASSIRSAKKFESQSLRFSRHDMRMPFGNKTFDFVFSFFTSFGYFNNWQENNKVVSNMAAALKKDGTLVIDYLNAAYAEKRLVAVEEKEIDGVWYHINRWSDERFIYKRIAIVDREKLASPAYTEQVAKLSINDFRELFGNNGLRVKLVYGDYELNDYDEQRSKRMILIAEKKCD